MPRTVRESQANSSVAVSSITLKDSGGCSGSPAYAMPASWSAKAWAARTMIHGGATLSDRDLGVADGSGVLAMNAMGEGTALRRVRTVEGPKPA